MSEKDLEQKNRQEKNGRGKEEIIENTEGIEALADRVREEIDREIDKFVQEDADRLVRANSQIGLDSESVEQIEKEINIKQELAQDAEDVVRAGMDGKVGIEAALSERATKVGESGEKENKATITAEEMAANLAAYKKDFFDSAEFEKVSKAFMKAYGEGRVPLGEIIKSKEAAGPTLEILRDILMTDFEKRGHEGEGGHKCATCGAVMQKFASFCGQCGSKFSGEYDAIFHDLVTSLDPLGEVFNADKEASGDTARKFKNNILYVMSEALRSYHAGDRLEVDLWLSEHVGPIQESAKLITDEKGSTDHVGEYIFANIIERTQSKELLEKTLEMASQEDSEKMASINITGLLSSEYPPYLKERKKDIARYSARKVGLEEDIVEKWDKAKEFAKKDSNGKKVYEGSYQRNIEAAKRLNAEKEGAAAILYSKFGIANFDRYTKEALVHQIEAQEQQVPYGVVVFPEADHNGAFFQNKEKLEKIRKKLLEGGYEMRLVEAASQFEMARRLNGMHAKYAQSEDNPNGNKMGFIILGGHGSKSSVNLGEHRIIDSTPPPIPDSRIPEIEYRATLERWQRAQKEEKSEMEIRNTIIAEDIEGEGGKGIKRATKKWFDEGAPTVFISYSTGAEGGIAEKAAEKLGLDTIAPEKPGYVEEIDVIFKNGKPAFEVEYATSEEEDQLYQKGQKVETKKYDFRSRDKDK